MRQPSFRRGLLWTYKLMIINAVVFVLHQLLEFWGQVPVADYLALSFGGLIRGYLWQFLTFQFLHGNTLHLLLNLVVIFFFGRAMEEALGARRMLQLYFTSGVVGGICQILFQVLMAVVRDPGYLQGGVVGASAGAFGLVAAFAVMFPERRITLLLFFVIPVSMSARMLLWASVALGVIGILVPNDGIAHAAHLGGILAAVLFVRAVVLEQIPLPKIRQGGRTTASMPLLGVAGMPWGGHGTEATRVFASPVCRWMRLALLDLRRQGP